MNRNGRAKYGDIAPRRLGGALPLVVIGVLIVGPGSALASASAPASQAPPPQARSLRGSPETALTDDPVAVAAREVNLQETGRLHAVGEPGTTIIEQGRATGTYNCSIVVHLALVGAGKVVATFTVKPSGGSVTGRGSARFVQQGSDGYFGGTIAITGGTGGFARASGANIGISGVINRETFNLTVHVHGKVDV